MGYPTEVRKFSFVSPPRAYGPTGPVGQSIVTQVTPTAKYINLELTTLGLKFDSNDTQKCQGAGAPPGQPVGLTGCYVTIYADGADIGIIVGATAASVSSSNAPSLSAVGTVGATGVYAGTTGTCHRIPSGTERRYLMQIGQDNFLGLVGSATGIARIHQSSGYGIEG